MENKCLAFLNLSFLLLVQLQFGQLVAVSPSVVKFLPGFQGLQLPFELETGYVGVDEGEDVQLFYYFVKSESNPKKDPLIFWLTGGPGCTSLSTLAYEIGPIKFEDVEYSGGVPTTVLNPYSWTKVASIIFVDLPVGTGFSYRQTSRAVLDSDLEFCNQGYEFIRKWLLKHPEFSSNPFYLGGESYSGIPIPIIAQLISDGNEAGMEPFVDLKGYILGNAMTFPDEENYNIPFAHHMGLIPDELYESLKQDCKGEYRRLNVDSYNLQCLKRIDAYEKCITGFLKENILEPDCDVSSTRSIKLITEKTALGERFQELVCPEKGFSYYYCRKDEHTKRWADHPSVREALHVREGTQENWERCKSSLVRFTISDARPYHLNLSRKGYRSLIYSGDHDMAVTHLSTEAWLKMLNFSIIDEWRPWKIHGQTAGYTRTYSNKMTYATLKGGGHTAPEFKPEECQAMFKRWASHQPL